jgi:predicted phosphodiesterase
MKILIFSDVHGNLPAFKKMLEEAGQIDKYICLGDVVGYGPWSNECIDLIYSLNNCVYLEGNHERDYVQGSYSGKDATVQAFFNFTYPLFNRFEQIKNLPKDYNFNGYIFTHTLQNKNIYPDSEIVINNNYVIGHSHHQFKIKQEKFVLYNAGSVGQNRGFINVINFLIYDDVKNEFEMKSITYNADDILNEMKKRGYPSIGIDYYKNKERLEIKTP